MAEIAQSTQLTVLPRVIKTAFAFEAEGDGTTVDTTALNDGITAINADGGGKLILPKGYTFLIDGPLVPQNNVELVIDGTLKLSDTAITDTDLGLIVKSSAATTLTNFRVSGTGTIQGPSSYARRAAGIDIRAPGNEIHVGSGLTFKNLRIGVAYQEIARGTIGTCYYEDMFGRNVGTTSYSGSCIAVIGAGHITIGDVIGYDIMKDAVYINPTGVSGTTPEKITVGHINVTGPTQSGVHTAFVELVGGDPNSIPSPVALAIRSGQYVTTGNVVCRRVRFGVLIQRESTDTAAMNLQDIAIGDVTVEDAMEDAVKGTDLATVEDLDSISIGNIIAKNIGESCVSFALTNRLKVGTITGDDIGNVTNSPGVSLTTCDNAQIGDIDLTTVTGDGLNLSSSPRCQIGKVLLDTVGTAGAGFDGLIVTGSSQDAENGSIERLVVEGAGAYDYAINMSQATQSKFRIGSLSIENAGTSGWINQANVDNLLGGTEQQWTMSGSNDEYPLGSHQGRALVYSLDVISDVNITGNGTNYHTFTFQTTAGIYGSLVTDTPTTDDMTQYVPKAMSLTNEQIGASKAGWRLSKTSSGSPTAIGQIALVARYFEMD